MTTDIGNIGHEATQLNAAFDQTGVTFHDRAAALAAFREGREIVNEDGELFVRYDSEILPLADALLRFAYDNRAICDGRTLPRTGAGTSRPGLASKSDFTTTREKLDFIAAHGSDAWERLPLTGVSSNELRTKQDWFRLPRAEKVRLTAADPHFFEKLPSATATASPVTRMTSVAGAKINFEALERHKQTRPASR